QTAVDRRDPGRSTEVDFGARGLKLSGRASNTAANPDQVASPVTRDLAGLASVDKRAPHQHWQAPTQRPTGRQQVDGAIRRGAFTMPLVRLRHAAGVVDSG